MDPEQLSLRTSFRGFGHSRKLKSAVSTPKILLFSSRYFRHNCPYVCWKIVAYQNVTPDMVDCMTFPGSAGNVVDCADKAIVSWRVEEENPRLRRPQIRRMIEEALPGKDVCFIRNPPYKEDTTGENDIPAVLNYKGIDSGFQ